MGTIGMDTYALVAVGAGAVLSVVAGARPDAHGGVGGIKPVIGGPLGPPWSGKRRRKEPLAPVLRTSVRRAIITIIAHLLSAETT